MTRELTERELTAIVSAAYARASLLAERHTIYGEHQEKADRDCAICQFRHKQVLADYRDEMERWGDAERDEDEGLLEDDRRHLPLGGEDAG